MRRLAMLALVILLGIVPAILQRSPAAGQEAAPPRAAAREQQFGMVKENGWLQVSRPEPRNGEATLFDGTLLQPYDVYFNEQYAAVPEVTSPPPEFMVVEVVAGEFALDISDQGTIIVDRPDGSPIVYLDRIEPPAAPYYVVSGRYVNDLSGDPCSRLCAIPEKTAVQLVPGDRAIAKAGSICVWCLLHQPGADLGQLFVSVELQNRPNVAGDFSWVQDWQKKQGGSTSALQPSRPTMMGWAYFHPQARCRGGG